MDNTVREIEKAVSAIKPLLAGREPEVQGAIMCELLAIWLAGHAPIIRDAVLETHVKLVREMIPISEWELFGKKGHPDTRSRS